MKNLALMAPKAIEHRFLFLRNLRVMLDVDLAEMYGVSTKRLNEQVRRNSKRFQATLEKGRANQE